MSEYHHYLYTPVGHVGVDRFSRELGVSRGRCREWILRIPLTRRWNLELNPALDYFTPPNPSPYTLSGILTIRKAGQ